MENLIYSAAVSVTIPNRAAPDALAWAARRLRERYGSEDFQRLVQFKTSEARPEHLFARYGSRKGWAVA